MKPRTPPLRCERNSPASAAHVRLKLEPQKLPTEILVIDRVGELASPIIGGSL